MKWFFLMIMMLSTSFVLYSFSNILPGTRKLLFSGAINSTLNRLVQNEFQKRIPKDRVFYIGESPTLTTCHRVTDCMECHISLPNVKVQDPKEALQIFLPYAKAYVDTMNNIREVRPYFADFPFPLDMWDLSVNFSRDSKTKMAFDDPYISSVSFCGSTLFLTRLYKEGLLPDGTLYPNLYKNIYKTPKVPPEDIQEMTIPKFDVKKVPTVIPEEKTFNGFNSGDEPEFNFDKEWAKKNNFLLIATGQVKGNEKHFGPKVRIEGAYAAQERRITLEEAKALVLQLRDDHLPFYIEKGWFKNFVDGAREDRIESNVAQINAQEYMAFKVSFWDKYIDRIQPPHIAEIRVIGTKARYFVSDELQRLQLIYEEELPRFEVEVPVLEVLPPKKKSALDPEFEAEALKKIKEEGIWPY